MFNSIRITSSHTTIG